MKIGTWTCGKCGLKMEVWTMPEENRIFLCTKASGEMRDVTAEGIDCLKCNTPSTHFTAATQPCGSTQGATR